MGNRNQPKWLNSNKPRSGGGEVPEENEMPLIDRIEKIIYKLFLVPIALALLGWAVLVYLIVYTTNP